MGDAQRADQVNEEERRRAAVQQLLEGVDVNPYKNNVRVCLFFVLKLNVHRVIFYIFD